MMRQKFFLLTLVTVFAIVTFIGCSDEPANSADLIGHYEGECTLTEKKEGEKESVVIKSWRVEYQFNKDHSGWHKQYGLPTDYFTDFKISNGKLYFKFDDDWDGDNQGTISISKNGESVVIVETEGRRTWTEVLSRTSLSE